MRRISSSKAIRAFHFLWAKKTNERVASARFFFNYFFSCICCCFFFFRPPISINFLPFLFLSTAYIFCPSFWRLNALGGWPNLCASYKVSDWMRRWRFCFCSKKKKPFFIFRMWRKKRATIAATRTRHPELTLASIMSSTTNLFAYAHCPWTRSCFDLKPPEKNKRTATTIPCTSVARLPR